MNRPAAETLVAYLNRLFQDWRPSPELAVRWAEEFEGKDEDAVKRSIDKHLASWRSQSPCLAEFLDIYPGVECGLRMERNARLKKANEHVAGETEMLAMRFGLTDPQHAAMVRLRGDWAQSVRAGMVAGGARGLCELVADLLHGVSRCRVWDLLDEKGVRVDRGRVTELTEFGREVRAGRAVKPGCEPLNARDDWEARRPGEGELEHAARMGRSLA